MTNKNYLTDPPKIWMITLWCAVFFSPSILMAALSKSLHWAYIAYFILIGYGIDMDYFILELSETS